MLLVCFGTEQFNKISIRITEHGKKKLTITKIRKTWKKDSLQLLEASERLAQYAAIDSKQCAAYALVWPEETWDAEENRQEGKPNTAGRNHSSTWHIRNSIRGDNTTGSYRKHQRQQQR